MGRMKFTEPTLRELYERAVNKAEIDAAAEWRRCFDTAADPTHSEQMAKGQKSAAVRKPERSLLLGLNPQPTTVALL
jgi:hypothetical protein